MRRRAAAAAVAVAIAAVGNAAAQEPPARGVRGEQRVLVVLATWGPQPFAPDDVRRVVFEEANAFFRASSYGVVSLSGIVTEWIPAFRGPTNCDAQATIAGARAAAARAGYDVASYERAIYLQPFVGCAFSGVAAGRDVLLDAELTSRLVAHELGHSFGLGHANTRRCFPQYCAALEYGDPYDTMGSGAGDFNAWAKFRLGWLPRMTTVRTNGTYDLHDLERPASGPQAFVVPTALDEYWFESRAESARTRTGAEVAPPGVLVRTGPPQILPTGHAVFTTSNALFDDPVGRGRPAMVTGDRFVVDGAFAVTVAGQRAGQVRLRFAWTDTTAPAAPRRVEIGVDDLGGRELTWMAAQESGSGIARYEVRIDGGRPQRVTGMPRGVVRLSLPVLLRGRHIVAVVAVDRAGNRSAPSRRRFVAG